MTDYEGYGNAGWDKYESHETLKKYIHANIGRLYDGHNTNEITYINTLITEGAKVEVASDANGAISYIGKVEEEWVFCTAAADDETADGAIITLVYKSNDGVEHTTYGTFTEALTTTETSFDPEVLDGYCAISCTIDGAVTTQDVTVGVTGMGTPMATISNTAVAATEIQLFGIGAVYARSLTEDNAGDSTVQYLDYMTPWGEVKKNATCTLTTTCVNEIRFIESDGTTYVKDFWIPIWFGTSAATTAGTDERLLTDIDIGANTDGSGGDVYGCIDQLVSSAQFSRMTAPEDGVADCWFVGIGCHGFIETALGDQYLVYVELTPKGSSYEKTIMIQFQENVHHEYCIQLEPDTDCTISVGDIDAAGHVTVEATYIVAKRI